MLPAINVTRCAVEVTAAQPCGGLVSRVGSSVTDSAACDSAPAGAGLGRHPIFDWVPGASLAPAPPPGYPARPLGVGASRRGAWIGKHFGGFSPRRDPLQRNSAMGAPPAGGYPTARLGVARRARGAVTGLGFVRRFPTQDTSCASLSGLRPTGTHITSLTRGREWPMGRSDVAIHDTASAAR